MKRLDPENYRKMAEPFATPAHANEALNKFMEELYELRNKHRMCDVLVVVSTNVLYDNGEEGRTMVSAHFGEQWYAEAMAAYALGKIQADHRARINKLMKHMGTRDVPADGK